MKLRLLTLASAQENSDKIPCAYCGKAIRDRLAYKDHIQRIHGVFEEGDDLLTTTDPKAIMRCNLGPMKLLLDREKQSLHELMANAFIVAGNLRLTRGMEWQPEACNLDTSQFSGTKQEWANEIVRYRLGLAQFSAQIRIMECMVRNGGSYGGGENWYGCV